MTRSRVSAGIAAAGALLIGGRGLWVFLQDGSYFLDSASVVLNLNERSLLETFQGPFGWGQHFPRLYLALIRGLRALLGPETWVTRLLPHAAYLAASVAWMRLFTLRFRERPGIVLLGVLLAASAPSWWTYSALVKQYSLDTLLAIALFLTSDAWLDETLTVRRRPWRIAALVLPVLLSYTYGIVLLARVSAWGLHGWRRGRRPEPTSAVAFAGALGAALALLWLVDARHSAGQDGLVQVWSGCIATEQPPGAWPGLLWRLLAGWYVGPTEFFFPPPLAAPVAWILVSLLVAGGVRALRGTFVLTGSAGPDWGSRSLGCLAAVAGVVAASFLLQYPMCAGRSNLFVLALEQLLVLEGLAWALDGARSARIPPRARGILTAAARLGLAALVAAMALHAVRVHQQLAPGLPLEDLRPQLPRVRQDPSLPVLVTPCIERQLRTLPEGLPGLDLRWLPVTDWEPLVPRGREVWIVHSRLNPGFCERYRRRLRSMTHGFDRPDHPKDQAVVYRATVRSESVRERSHPRRPRDGTR